MAKNPQGREWQWIGIIVAFGPLGLAGFHTFWHLPGQSSDRRSHAKCRGRLVGVGIHVASALNSTAISQGVEPVRSLGESYVAVCRLSSPRFDHASRAVTWARAATRAIQRLEYDWTKFVSLRFGLASGELDVLLLGRFHATYDIWGNTLRVARCVVQETEPGYISLSDSTYTLLTDVDGFAPRPPIENPALGIITTWSRPLVERFGIEITPPESQSLPYAAK